MSHEYNGTIPLHISAFDGSCLRLSRATFDLWPERAGQQTDLATYAPSSPSFSAAPVALVPARPLRMASSRKCRSMGWPGRVTLATLRSGSLEHVPFVGVVIPADALHLRFVDLLVVRGIADARAFPAHLTTGLA